MGLRRCPRGAARPYALLAIAEGPSLSILHAVWDMMTRVKRRAHDTEDAVRRSGIGTGAEGKRKEE